MIVYASMELAFIIVPRTDLPASKLPAFIESVHSVESAEDGLEVDVDCAVAVALVELDMFDRTKLETDISYRRTLVTHCYLPWR